MDDSANFLFMIDMIVNVHLSAHSHVLQMKKWLFYSFNIETDFYILNY